MDWGPTVPELFVRSVETQVTEATLEDMLDTILRAWTLLHHLEENLNIHRQVTEDKPTGSLLRFIVFW